MENVKTLHGMVHICQDQTELAKQSAQHFTQVANQAIADRGRCTVALSGGHTPPLLYEQLTALGTRNQIDWSKVHFFVGDERCVPLDNKDSNWGLAERLLLGKIKVADENLHPIIDPDVNPKQAAEDYEQHLQEFFHLKPGEMPRFDLVILGMGPDGHTASLFPGSKALNEQTRLVMENFVDKVETTRITLTFPTLNHAGDIMFMVEGAEKSHVFADAVQSERPLYPVQRIAPTSGSVTWYVDQDVARDLMAKLSR